MQKDRVGVLIAGDDVQMRRLTGYLVADEPGRIDRAHPAELQRADRPLRLEQDRRAAQGGANGRSDP